MQTRRGTDWFLTYLIRESVISEQFSSISEGILARSVVQSILTVAVLLGLFLYIYSQTKRASRLRLEKETADAAFRVKQEEMERRLSLQEELLSQKEQGRQQDRMIEALSSDYRSVYYLELDKNAGVCYRARSDLDGLEATRRIRALDRTDARTVPIIALTANAFDEDVQRSLQAGLNAHLSKPVEPENLYETLESLIP